MKLSSQRLTLVTAVLVAVAVGIFLYVRANRDAVSAGDALSLETLRAQPSLGESNAPVKLAVFEDFKCPACLNFEENVFPQLKRDFVDTGEVEVFFLTTPLSAPIRRPPRSRVSALTTRTRRHFGTTKPPSTAHKDPNAKPGPPPRGSWNSPAIMSLRSMRARSRPA